MNERGHDPDSEIKIDGEDEHSDLNVASKSFEIHDNDDEYFIDRNKATKWSKNPCVNKFT